MSQLLTMPKVNNKEIRVLAVTWNMARKEINAPFEDLLANHKDYNVVVLAL